MYSAEANIAIQLISQMAEYVWLNSEGVDARLAAGLDVGDSVAPVAAAATAEDDIFVGVADDSDIDAPDAAVIDAEVPDADDVAAVEAVANDADCELDEGDALEEELAPSGGLRS